MHDLRVKLRTIPVVFIGVSGTVSGGIGTGVGSVGTGPNKAILSTAFYSNTLDFETGILCMY